MTRDRKIVENQGVPEYATYADLPNPVDFKGVALVQSDYSLYKSNGSFWIKANENKLGARKVTNLLTAATRFPVGSVLGTGSKVETTEANAYGVKNGILSVESGSVGRAYWTQTITIAANTWYALSVEVTAINLTAGNFINTFAGSATIDRGSIILTGAQVMAGGVGRYSVVFCSTAGGTIIPRIGVGINANQAGMSATFKNLQLEIIDSTLGLVPSEYVYPQHSSVFNFINPNTLDSNKKVVVSAISKYFNVKPFSSILAIGDSRSDETTDIPGQLDTLLGATGAVQVHAKGGWTSLDVTGPTASHDVNLNFVDALSGNLLRRTFSSAGDEELSTYTGYKFDTLMICDFGFNNVSGGSEPTELLNADKAYEDIISFASAALSLGMNVIMGSNNPFNANTAYTAAKLTAVKYLDAKLQKWCTDNNAIFVYTYDALGDSTDRDKLSDGGGTTTDYSEDALHLNAAGSTLYATLIKAAIDKYR